MEYIMTPFNIQLLGTVLVYMGGFIVGRSNSFIDLKGCIISGIGMYLISVNDTILL